MRLVGEPEAELAVDLGLVGGVGVAKGGGDVAEIRTGTGPEAMASLRDAAIGALPTAGIANIAAANRHHARDSTRPLAMLGIT
ncbi:hypothetical protein FXF50_00280 [Micromonospora sp. AP08]|uniref:hypothetical protein n=1 Tax=Micromonospora sp. AP08 TaxID=2604467 RepID=UPI0011D44FC6|nr:hypothetical protein [Micromonospora sp. AP08]TYB40219.1 hypothetical protein FXF50_00280 [Micromonospora sp. AP08]